ncbi:ABC transporter substrate-binding protein [Rhodococcoides kyotonense]|uniref:Iron(III) transport system substrate-binding protein n=1 Tax=Rhodococcoides kyotonense TaxID=398843 RepID=A0A239LZG2_9NOCA|nr:extracellular solute-binding protein [Rhodococcus kyotonensis]SNT35906.1 iron(III) transport system substrate-binding protein [Rhodococcus kyotonensis]
MLQSLRTSSSCVGRKTVVGRVLRYAVVASVTTTLILTVGCSSPAQQPAQSDGVSNSDAGGDAAWQETVQAAKSEGRVVVYLSITGVEDTLKQAWSAAYPDITLEVFRAGSAELLSRLDQEKGTATSGADAVVMADAGWYRDNAARLLPPTGPGYYERWDGTEYSYEDGKYVLVDAAPLGLVSNTDAVEELGADPIEEYEDLLQPELAGNLAFTPAQNASAALQWWYTVSDAVGGTDALEKIADLAPHPYPSLMPLVQAVAAGEQAVGAYSSLAAAYELQDQGAPIEVTVPSPAVGGGHFVSVVDWSANKNAAQVFRNWILSPAGQIALNGAGDMYTPLSIADIPEAPAEMVSIPDDMVVTDGIVTAEQQKWFDDAWTPIFEG